jgi:hypothetical protein
LPNEVEANVRDLPYKRRGDPELGIGLSGSEMDENLQSEDSFGRNRYNLRDDGEAVLARQYQDKAMKRTLSGRICATPNAEFASSAIHAKLRRGEI